MTILSEQTGIRLPGEQPLPSPLSHKSMGIVKALRKRARCDRATQRLAYHLWTKTLGTLQLLWKMEIQSHTLGERVCCKVQSSVEDLRRPTAEHRRQCTALQLQRRG
uniref:Uncharacterized protein n=1 Tax=Knipowitschia caucasica TaxID=637954 RepID=A0AAV2J956_KNICA